MRCSIVRGFTRKPSTSYARGVTFQRCGAGFPWPWRAIRTRSSSCDER